MDDQDDIEPNLGPVTPPAFYCKSAQLLEIPNGRGELSSIHNTGYPASKWENCFYNTGANPYDYQNNRRIFKKHEGPVDQKVQIHESAEKYYSDCVQVGK